MRTLKENYKANIAILKENMRRGMTASQAIGVVKQFRNLFIKSNLYGTEEKMFINAMYGAVNEHFNMYLPMEEL